MIVLSLEDGILAEQFIHPGWKLAEKMTMQFFNSDFDGPCILHCLHLISILICSTVETT